MKTCETCEFSTALNKYLLCRRSPPIPWQAVGSVKENNKAFGLWPIVRNDDWCGEHKPKEPSNEPA